MQFSISGLLLSACLLPAILAPVARAEVYKWVDASGQTHYSERKSEAQGARTAEVKLPASPPPPPMVSTPSADYLRAQSKFAPPPMVTPHDKPVGPGSGGPPQAASDGRDHGTDTSRCALARDVLSGAVRHGNGKPTDKYDRDVAQSDVKQFCRNR